ncbi:MAG: glucose-1-phosphate thymidylyltransferase RfbA [Rhabdochlamydiaceae bacterium]|nr:glucose-1-phosphate thymidylyltransferase RfbA [Candidatus Amphrikana amoebophyrae]
MKGIVLAGGTGSRLFPITTAVSKQLLPIGGKPMIYYPLSTLMLSGIDEIAIISTPEDLPGFEKLFGDGSQLGLTLSYIEQPKPEGLAQAFILAEDFIGDDPVALVLGDNIFHSHDLKSLLNGVKNHQEGGIVFGYEVTDPSRYGVVSFDERHNVIDIIEKPTDPQSNFAVTGLYFYDNDVVEIAKNLDPSARGELEITDVNVSYLKRKKLKVKLLERGFAWLDTGTHEDLHHATVYIDTIQKRQGIQIGCIEEIAYEMGLINLTQLEVLATALAKSEYGRYLFNFIRRELTLNQSHFATASN